MKANTKDYNSQKEADETVQMYIIRIQKMLGEVLRELDNDLLPQVKFENQNERNTWKNLRNAIINFRTIEIDPMPDFILQIKPELKESLINLYGTATEKSLNKIINELLQQRIDKELTGI